ncbi:MAG: TadE/TadG family type IV pilus assembly protein [Pseudomonadota bacterium]
MIKRYHWRNIRGVFRANGGVSAVEFALIAPLMLLLYFGCVELSLMMSLDRKVTTATATLGDLTARASVVTDSDLDDIFQATRMIFQPSPLDGARMRVSSLYRDGTKVKVRWSDGKKMTAYKPDTVVSVPNQIVPTNGSIIYAEIEYDYDSAIGYFIKDARTLSDKFYLRPRRVDEITRVRN